MTNMACEKKTQFEVVPPVRWEHVPCNLCGRDDAQPYHHERLPYFDKMLDFHIVRCRGCGLVYTNPRLIDYNATYMLAGQSDPKRIESHALAKTPVFTAALDEIDAIRKSCNHATTDCKAKLLDVGCGSGHFLAMAQERGYEVCGIEPAGVSADYALEKFSFPVIKGNVLDTDLTAEHFDVITALDVIEHVSDPLAVLHRCARWLKPGGIMALRFPSARWQKIKAIILHNLLSSRRAVFGPTMHLYFFNKDTFAKMAHIAGLEILLARTTPAEANSNNVFIDSVKMAGNVVVRGIEMLSGSVIGNLEIYCCKRPGNK